MLQFVIKTLLMTVTMSLTLPPNPSYSSLMNYTKTLYPSLANFSEPPHPSSVNCTVNYFDQTIDHFNWAAPLGGKRTYRQRYFTYDKYWKSTGDKKGPIFFYFGNEDNVELYVNATGLMWENAEQFNALLVFAEHRYYGSSIIFQPGTKNCMNWLTTEQAMADFATLIRFLKISLHTESSPVIGFGGSYGGMMGSWFRMKYPALVQGVIAGSAPIWSFTGLSPPYDYNMYYKLVTRDASEQGGATDNCKDNLKQAWPRIATIAHESGRKGLDMIGHAFRTCNPLQDYNDAWNLIMWAQGPWATMAMGDFPYPSSYLLHGHGILPAWPVRVACSPLNKTFILPQEDTDLLNAVREAVGVYYNHSGDQTCFYNGDQYAAGTEFELRRHTMTGWLERYRAKQITAQYQDIKHSSKVNDSSIPPLPTNLHPAHWNNRDDGIPWSESCTGDWGFQWCTEMTQPFTSGTDEDFYYPLSIFNITSSTESCMYEWNVSPRADWVPTTFGGKSLGSISNIVFSNGYFDPWSGGGILSNLSSTVRAVYVPSGAHHLDLMFSNPLDPDDVKEARAIEVKYIAMWIKQYE